MKIFHGERLDLWSFHPIADPTPPPRLETDHVVHPIDAFLAADGVAARPEADRRILARRLYFDLTGLPPTPEQVAAFVSDSVPDAYERLVDELLASPRYGEHWARLWLDAVRYSDSNGFDWDEFRPEAWRFRDYVIRSLNADKPFDRFAREQLAGDELVPGAPRDAAEQDALIATAFLRLGPWDNSAGGFGETERVRQQMINDLVETTGAAFLGLSMSCARCHNHKTDPISQADYYRLSAFFAPVTFRNDLPLDLAAEQTAINEHNAAVESDLKVARDEYAAALAGARVRLWRERLTKLSADEQVLLATPDEKRDDEAKKRAAELAKKIEVNDDDARGALSDEEKPRFETAKAKVQELKKEVRSFTTGLCAMDSAEPPKPTHVLFQGNLTEIREAVEPGFLSALDPNPATPSSSAREKSSGLRSALADWIVDPENPFTARVIVNRIWQGHFGSGLVATPNDFGFAGARPTHPALLDWLAREFVREGWSLKKLHRLIVSSAAYRQENSAPRRLSAEQLRDAMLVVSGTLTAKADGPPVWPPLPAEVLQANPAFLDDNAEKTKGWYPSPEDQLGARSIFLIQKRTVRVPFMETFDLPDNAVSCARRTESTVAPQALTLLNNDFTTRCAKAFAARVERDVSADPKTQVERAFGLALQRPPDASELGPCLQMRNDRSLTELCRVLMNVNEFIYLD